MFTNIVIVVVLAVVILAGLRGSFKHLRGEGSCCGGESTVKPKKKKLTGQIVNQKEIRIEGMRCVNCQNRVTEALNEIEGLSAKVSYKRKNAQLKMERQVSDEEIKKAVEHAGYKVVA
ncbi:heavy-metal-associated domain-containing protein [Blautia hydrogenotrophica]|uniref:HMA domain-containing protein n=1 Tax=Blautia hydrogenotrophica (strain DSM 10507 / JCM 14656 / S5a33) TaxID=476272 RepID=C0CP95_BLAHS|nr:heavy-metal-associated domain-containing protein [Blautia hydrogenotrophica]SCH68027.1 Copper-exporting P-type ATPase A [uncultured Blautia sp.]EEG48410.1 heavy metal-associated domain protein [Blautia hydrogenotrophica DSM 10507]MCT6797362.1 heavy-metal-associated domain-containing protein [Blautia hydrogenotrophica]MEE0461561.1 heavy-metal-associated domain-containing protein [Blautia hydrogenotrophica]WPX84678.1 hypothetical protein BLHYD_26950 [Blautia hydrogenotrophica DSM 10507]